MTTYYLSGPMRGQPNHGHDTFCDVEQALADDLEASDIPYYTIINPAKNFDGDKMLDVATYMKLDLQQVLESDALVLLPGWEKSEGARLEVDVALMTGKKFYRAFYIEFDESWVFSETDTYTVEEMRHEDEAQGLAITDYVASRMRAFATGATRDTDAGKLDYEGFLSPAVLEAFAAYMHTHRVQSDGNLRDSDNWQKGMPLDVYMKSMWRHFMDVWKAHRGLPTSVDHVEALMALMFNVQGMAYEILMQRGQAETDAVTEGLRRKLSGDAA